jgi:hypothetical protein
MSIQLLRQPTAYHCNGTSMLSGHRQDGAQAWSRELDKTDVDRPYNVGEVEFTDAHRIRDKADHDPSTCRGRNTVIDRATPTWLLNT